MNDIYSRLLAHDVPQIQVTVDPDDEDIRYIGFTDRHQFGWFFEDDVERFFCDPVKLALTLRICNWYYDIDPYGCDDEEGMKAVFNSVMADDTAWIVEQIKDAIEEYEEEPFIYGDILDEAEKLITILQAE